jgi:DNA-directed RNA polymerase subunit RPC12/RpoP
MGVYDQIYLGSWNKYSQYAAFILFGAALVVLLAYFVRLMTIKDMKKKYDYINLHEIKMLWYSSVLLLIAIGFFANTLFVESGVMWFFVRIFMTVMVGLILGIVVSNVLRFYYPFYVEKRLKALRYSPRLSPKTGKAMKLLSEDEEDVYLDEGMQAEENVFSVDYDVWIDEETGFTKIEKYAGHLHALQCPECSYQTFKVKKEEILESPSETTEGELMKFFRCDYCGHKERKSFRIAKLHSLRLEPMNNPVPM